MNYLQNENNDKMINSTTTIEDEEEVEWIEVTNDEINENEEKENKIKNKEEEQQQNNSTKHSDLNLTKTSNNLKNNECLPDELSSISAIESDEQSEEIIIPTTKDLLIEAAEKVAYSIDNKGEEKNNNNVEKIIKEEKTPESIKLIFYPNENKNNNFKQIPTIYYPNNNNNNIDDYNKQKEAAEIEAERLLKYLGFGEENKKEKESIIEIKIQPFSYENNINNFNIKEEKDELIKDQENIKIDNKEENKEKINLEEEKIEETKYFEVPPINIELTRINQTNKELPGYINYLIPEENKKEKIITETIILPKNVKFIENNKEINDLDDYEQKLRRRSKEALELVDKICGLQTQEIEKKPPISRPSQFNVETEKPVNSAKNELKEALTAGIHGLSGNDFINKEKVGEAIQIGGGPILDVECVSVSPTLLSSPMDCLLLPNNLLLVVDSDNGILLISIESKQVLKQLIPKQNVWRNPECVCLGNIEGEEEQTIFVLLEYNINNDKEVNNNNLPPSSPTKGILKERQIKEEENNQNKIIKPEWRRYICRFSINNNFSMLNRIEAPKWLLERVIWNCKICSIPKSNFIYLAANTPNQGFLFELNCLNGRWIECKGTRKNSQFADINYFASVGPVTELLLIETNRCYVQLISIYNSTVGSTRILGICERPGALCVDNYGNVLIFDRSSSSVGLYSRAFLEKVGDLAFVERANCQLSAYNGLIAVLCKPTKELRLQKYGEKLKNLNKQMFGENYEIIKEKKIKKEEKIIEEIEDDNELIKESIPLMRA